jgi:hypothetical protein
MTLTGLEPHRHVPLRQWTIINANVADIRTDAGDGSDVCFLGYPTREERARLSRASSRVSSGLFPYPYLPTYGTNNNQHHLQTVS